MTPVISASPKASAMTMSDGTGLMGRKCALWNASVSSSRAAPTATISPTTQPPVARSTLSVRACAIISPLVAPMASLTAVCPRRDTARARRRLATLAQAIRSTSPQTASKIWKAAPVLLFHLGDASACGNDVDHLLGKHADHVRHPVGGIAGIILHPLPQHSGETRRHSLDRSAWPQAAHHA